MTKRLFTNSSALVIMIVATAVLAPAHGDAQPVAVKEVFVKPAQIYGGQAFQYTIRLNRRGNITLKISTSHPSIVGLPVSGTLQIRNRNNLTVTLPTNPIVAPARPVTVYVSSGAKTYGASVLVKPGAPPSSGSSKKTYLINTSRGLLQLRQIAAKRGFKFSVERLSPMGRCGFARQVPLKMVAAGIKPATAPQPDVTCRFTLFGGRTLRDGWSVKNVVLRSQYPKVRYWSYVPPQPGSNNLQFAVVIQELPGGLPDAFVEVKAIALEGPYRADWSQAF